MSNKPIALKFTEQNGRHITHFILKGYIYIYIYNRNYKEACSSIIKPL